MSQRKNSKNNAPKQSPLQVILAAVVIVIAGIVYIVTGVDLTGGQLGTVPTVPPTASVVSATNTPRATTAPRVTATPAPVTAAPTTRPSGRLTNITLENGTGATRGFWTVYFTVPQTDRTKWQNGIDAEIAKSLADVRQTLDIAAFEWNNPALTQAVLDAHKRGVKVRMVADNEHTIEDSGSTIKQLADAGIPIVYDNRSAFMHNKFMILDGQAVWTGSMNFQQNDIFRNNNNVLRLNNAEVARIYTREFETMFTDKVFGPRKAANSGTVSQSGVNIRIFFAPQNDVINPIIEEISKAQTQIRFMTFSFTEVSLSAAMLERFRAGVSVEGVFELRGSETASSELRTLRCAGVTVFQDGNPATLHHKVVIVDDHTVITGSFNFSNNAIRSNDENLLIINNRDIAALYLQEYERMKAIARTPDRVTC
jgi:phosphatidylserine/phosphatidylglycerophosphate/cardiolipin synthase-like enzyme